MACSTGVLKVFALFSDIIYAVSDLMTLESSDGDKIHLLAPETTKT